MSSNKTPRTVLYKIEFDWQPYEGGLSSSLPPNERIENELSIALQYMAKFMKQDGVLTWKKERVLTAEEL